jgi:eukaryotic-like serine/threonine-protein kinase
MTSCPQCKQELGAGDPAGLCPQCLILGAFDSSLGADTSKTQTIHAATTLAADEDFVRYHVVRPLGEGGMGTVYLAEQREPIRRRVALKVVKLGMDTSQVLARFANERQALAMMDHPNIARIFDAGTTPKGRPYFVMEYIEGVSVTQYCDSKRMTIVQRVELFLAICHAVHHAHQRGIIHRDLKPSNVLVMEQDGAPVPKVIDFGIAKATDQWAVEKTLLTQFGQMVGTPEYASPEQAEVTTGDVDESSDVYSLGVILYELLVGAVPYDTASMRQAGLGEMLRIIREEEAPALSRKLTTMGAEAEVIATRRQTDLAALRRLVNGDLNSIAMKALEKARERRYPSVTELAADLRRYLQHRPVLASPVGRLYRARKFLRRHRPAALLGTAGLALILASGLTVWWFVRRDSPPKPTLANVSAATLANKATIVLGEFANTTGDPAFNGALRQVMAEELGKSPYFDVLSDARMSQTLHLMVRPVDTKLTPGVAAEICERTGGAAVVDSSVTSLGTQYLSSLHARNCRTGDVLDQEQAQATKKEDVFQALGVLANRFQKQAAESLARLPKDTNVQTDVTTPSLEAWRSYKAAMIADINRSKRTESISLLKRATELDPNFAMAYAYMGRSYDAMGEADLGAENISKAFELRNRVSDTENFFITFNYYRQVPRNLELARQTLESWSQKYPSDFVPRGFLSAFTSAGRGQYETGVEEGLKALELDPDYSIGYENVAWDYIYLDRWSEAEALLRKASEHKVETADYSVIRYFIAFLRKDQAAMEREVTQRQGKLQAQGWFEHQQAMTLAYQGRLKEAAQLSDSAVRLAGQAGLRERPAQFAGARAVWNALFGIRDEAQRSAAAALSLYQGRDADYGPAFTLELLHDMAQAEPIEAELEKRYPQDTPVQFSYLPTLRALRALNRNDPAKALDMTRAAAPNDFAIPGTAYYGGAAFFGSLYPVYVRGLAYSRLGRHREAAAEFQKILDHPGIMLNDPMGPMARLQLARALAASGDRAKSAAVYKDLLAIWKDADPDVPVVQEAKAESAKQL